MDDALHGLSPPAPVAVQTLVGGTCAAPILSAARRFSSPMRSLMAGGSGSGFSNMVPAPASRILRLHSLLFMYSS